MSCSYGQFCPVSMAAEVVCSRWTVLVIRELLCGSTRFNDLRRGVPRMSPALLSKRLKELEQAGVVRVVPTAQAGINEYRLTEAGEELRPAGHGPGHVGAQVGGVDACRSATSTRRCSCGTCGAGWTPGPSRPGARRFSSCTRRWRRSGATTGWWSRKGEVDLCYADPGYEVDLWVRCPLRVMTSIWMGYSSLRAELASGALEVEGAPALARSMPAWLGLSPFARAERRDVA